MYSTGNAYFCYIWSGLLKRIQKKQKKDLRTYWTYSNQNLW